MLHRGFIQKGIPLGAPGLQTGHGLGLTYACDHVHPIIILFYPKYVEPMSDAREQIVDSQKITPEVGVEPTAF
jgi:hypothetical protein